MTDFADHLRIRPAWVDPCSIAWGEADQAAGTITIYKPEGEWFTFDLKTGETTTPVRDVPVAPEMTEAEIVASMHAHADTIDSRSVCYFIGADEGPIKIGHSIDPKTRLASFQMGCPIRLMIYATAPGGDVREMAYHYQFRESRAHGEWFERCPEILAEIDRLTA